MRIHGAGGRWRQFHWTDLRNSGKGQRNVGCHTKSTISLAETPDHIQLSMLGFIWTGVQIRSTRREQSGYDLPHNVVALFACS